jgi:hypothetical protein
MGKDIIPFVILGALGLGVVVAIYMMFKSSKKDDHHGPATHVPIHAPTPMQVHAGRIVDTSGTISSVDHKAHYSNQYLRRNLF